MNKDIKDLKIVNCHLGQGASVCAIKNGVSVDTSMGFTPLGGIPMGTRSGDLDPSVVTYIAKYRNHTPEEMDEILNKKSMTDHGDIEERMKESEQNYYKTCINIEVHFEEQESGLIQEYFPDCQIEKMMNGVCRTFIGVPAKERLWKALLLSFGDRVKVVAPEEYKRELIDTARNFLSNYDS